MGDTRVDGSRRWDVLWVHYEAEELRVHHRTTIPSDEARAVVMAVLASGRVPPMQATAHFGDRDHLDRSIVITPIGAS